MVSLLNFVGPGVMK